MTKDDFFDKKGCLPAKIHCFAGSCGHKRCMLKLKLLKFRKGLLGYFSEKLYTLVLKSEGRDHKLETSNWTLNGDVKFANLYTIKLNNEGRKIHVPNLFSGLENLILNLNDNHVSLDEINFKKIKNTSTQAIYAIMSYTPYSSIEISKFEILSNKIEVYYNIIPNEQGTCFENTCFDDIKFNKYDLFSTFYHRQVSCHNNQNHISRQPFPGSSRIKGWQVIMYKSNGYFKKDLAHLKSATNTNNKLPPMTYEERKFAVDNWLNTLPDSGNNKRLRKYLHQCIDWYHGKPHYGWHTNLEYRIRWKNHMLWALSSPILDYNVSFFHKSEISKDYKPEIEITSLKETIDKGTYINQKPKPFFDSEVDLNIINTPNNKDTDTIKKLIKNKKGINQLVFPIETQINNIQLGTAIDFKKVLCFPKEFEVPLMDRKEHSTTVECSSCNKVHKFMGKKYYSQTVGDVRKRGYFYHHELDLPSNIVEDDWVKVSKKTYKLKVAVQEKLWSENYYAVLHTKDVNEDNSMPISLSPYYKDSVNYSNHKQFNKKVKKNKKQASNNRKGKKDTGVFGQNVKTNVYPNKLRPICSNIKRKYEKDIFKFISINNAIRVLYNKMSGNYATDEQIKKFMEICSHRKSCNFPNRKWRFLFGRYFNFSTCSPSNLESLSVLLM